MENRQKKKSGSEPAQFHREEKNNVYDKFYSVLENMNDGFILLDKKWKFLIVNKKAGELIGKKPEELIGAQNGKDF